MSTGHFFQMQTPSSKSFFFGSNFFFLAFLCIDPVGFNVICWSDHFWLWGPALLYTLHWSSGHTEFWTSKASRLARLMNFQNHNKTYINTIPIENAGLLYLGHLHLSGITWDEDKISFTTAMAILHLFGQFVIVFCLLSFVLCLCPTFGASLVSFTIVS